MVTLVSVCVVCCGPACVSVCSVLWSRLCQCVQCVVVTLVSACAVCCGHACVTVSGVLWSRMFQCV